MTVDDLGNTAFDYDAYDSQLFKLPSRSNTGRLLAFTDLTQGSRRKSSASVSITRQLSHPELYDPLMNKDMPVAKVGNS